MDLPSTGADDNHANFENKKSNVVTNFSRGATPTVLTSFSEALNEKSFDENEMRDVQLYEENYEEKNINDKSIVTDQNVYKEEIIDETDYRKENDAATSEHLEFVKHFWK